MTEPLNLSLRQLIEGMTLNFSPAAAGDLQATIQFEVSEPEAGTYHLRIADGDCTFHLGSVDEATLTITTPPEVWLQLSRGELDGQEALMQGLYQVHGDFGLLLRMGELFKSAGESPDVSAYAAPPGQRPAGPIPLSGMAWMALAFVPWILFWVLFDIPSVPSWLAVGAPLLVSLLLVVYRLAFDRPTWLEWGGLGFFALAGLLTLLNSSPFATWGSVIGSLAMGVLWLGSLVRSGMPLSGEYSCWAFVRPLWRTSLFRHPNAVISLVWGGQFLLAALLGVGAHLFPNWAVVLTVLRYLLQVLAFIFTSVYQKGATSRSIANVERSLAQIRTWALLGLVIAVGIALALFLTNI